jgi:hypothetical protein
MSPRRRANHGEEGTVIPLVVLVFLLAGTLLAASVAGSAALVAHRRLAADCDGAALAAAAELDRGRLGNPGATGLLALDGARARAAATAYLARAAPATTATIVAGTSVTVTCRTTVRVPFGAVIARPHGIRASATATAATVSRPST